ncbi:Ger(x)C family spore germination protein [Alkalihalobacillus sp. NPDC078783]
MIQQRSIVIIILSLFFLSGCWDEQLLKDVALINSQAIDYNSENDTVKLTIALVSGNSNEKVPTNTTIVSAEGKSIRDSRTELDKKVGSELFASKNQVTMFSRELAEKDIYAALDGNYRSPLSALTARLAVIEGEAESILHAETENKPLISDYLRDLLISAEDTGAIPSVNLQNTLTTLYDDGQDIVMPRLKTVEQKAGAKIVGTALFSDRQMTGELNSEESILLLLLSNNKKGAHRMTRKVQTDEVDPLYDYVTVDVENMKRNLRVSKNELGDFEVQIDLVLKMNANEYPGDDLYKRHVIKRLNTQLSEELTKEANIVLTKIKEANCDYLAIGRKVNAFYYSDWQNYKWKDVYPTIEMKANVDVEIIYHGIIN